MIFSKHINVPVLLLISLFFVGCKEQLDTNGPQTKATADFSWDKNRIEIFEPVTFTSHSQQASRQHWDFGNAQFSDQPVVTTQFYSAGTYPVKLTVYDGMGRATEKVKHIKIFNRMLQNVTVKSISYLDETGQPWDSDGSGPDVYMYFTGGGMTNFAEYIIGNGTPADFPKSTNRFNNRSLTNGIWNIQLKESSLNGMRIMAEWDFNPIQMGITRPDGTGSVTLISGQNEVIIDYNVE